MDIPTLLSWLAFPLILATGAATAFYTEKRRLWSSLSITASLVQMIPAVMYGNSGMIATQTYFIILGLYVFFSPIKTVELVEKSK